MEEVSGGRMHYMFNRVGGLKEDLPAGWLARASGAPREVRERLPELTASGAGRLRTSRRGRVASASCDASRCSAYGVSGPVARASGVAMDLRVDEPYLAYGELLADGVLRPVLRTGG